MSIAASVSATGIEASKIGLQVIAHNLANQQSTAFQRVTPSMTNLVYEDIVTGGGGPKGQTELGIPVLQAGAGVRVAATLADQRRGTPEPTQNQLDIYINGPGYLQVDLGNGLVGHTRAGNLKIDETGVLRTAADYPLMDNITIDMTVYSGVIIDKSGKVYGIDPAQVENARHVELGQINLWTFTNPQGLEAREDTIFIQSPEAGAATSNLPGIGNMGTIMQGYKERSTVEGSVELVRAIEIQQWSQSNATLLKIAEEMDKANLNQIASAA